jgi:hypothetical protein
MDPVPAHGMTTTATSAVLNCFGYIQNSYQTITVAEGAAVCDKAVLKRGALPTGSAMSVVHLRTEISQKGTRYVTL